MIPNKLIVGNKRYKLIKIYENFVLYENEKTKIRETFSKFSLGLVKEQVKPRRKFKKGGYKGGNSKH